MMRIDSKQIKKLEHTLARFTRDGFPLATRDTLNMAAANARKSARRIIEEGMVLKGAKGSNPALRGVQFEQTHSIDPRTQESRVGHVAGFWPVQEFGGTVHKKGHDGVVLPTSEAANQGRAAQRTKRVAKRNYLSKIKLNRDTVRAKTRQQRNAILINIAREKGATTREVFLDLGARKGIFRVTRNKIVMLYDLSNTSVLVPPRPAIHPAAKRQAAFIPENYERALRFQLRRAGVKT